MNEENTCAKKTQESEQDVSQSMDSDTETYDTEGLSMMDINDIIGVQSEPVNDSTLESEIDALSKIITDSKDNERTPAKEDESDEKNDASGTFKDKSTAERQPEAEQSSKISIDNSMSNKETAENEEYNVSALSFATSNEVTINKKDGNESFVELEETPRIIVEDETIQTEKTEATNNEPIIVETDTGCQKENSSIQEQEILVAIDDPISVENKAAGPVDEVTISEIDKKNPLIPEGKAQSPIDEPIILDDKCENPVADVVIPDTPIDDSIIHKTPAEDLINDKTEILINDPVSSEDKSKVPVIVEENIEDPVSSEEQSKVTVTVEKNVETPLSSEVTSEVSITMEENVENPVSSEVTSEVSITVEKNVENPVSSEVTSEVSMTVDKNVEDPAFSEMTSEVLMIVKENVEDTVSSEVTSEVSIIVEENVEDPMSSEVTSKGSVTVEENVENPVSSEVKSEIPMLVKENVEGPMSSEVTSKGSITVEENVENPLSSEVKSEIPLLVKENVEDPMSSEVTSKGSITVEENVINPISSEVTSEIPMIVEENVVDPISSEVTSEVPITVNENVENSVSSEVKTEVSITLKKNVENTASLEAISEIPIIVEENFEDPVSSEKKSEVPITEEESVEDRVSSEKKLKVLIVVDENVENPVSSEEKSEVSIDAAMIVEDNLEDPVEIPFVLKNMVESPTEVPVKDSIVTEENTNTTVDEPIEEPIVLNKNPEVLEESVIPEEEIEIAVETPIMREIPTETNVSVEVPIDEPMVSASENTSDVKDSVIQDESVESIMKNAVIVEEKDETTFQEKEILIPAQDVQIMEEKTEENDVPVTDTVCVTSEVLESVEDDKKEDSMTVKEIAEVPADPSTVVQNITECNLDEPEVVNSAEDQMTVEKSMEKSSKDDIATSQEIPAIPKDKSEVSAIEEDNFESVSLAYNVEVPVEDSVTVEEKIEDAPDPVTLEDKSEIPVDDPTILREKVNIMISTPENNIPVITKDTNEEMIDNLVIPREKEKENEDIVTDILESVDTVPDLSEILEAEEDVAKEAVLSLVEEDVPEKLPEEAEILNKELEKNIESLEGLLDLIPQNENSTLKTAVDEKKEDMDMALLLEEAPAASISQNEEYIENVIDSCLSIVDDTLEKSEGKDVMLIPAAESSELVVDKEVEGPDLDLTFEMESEREAIVPLDDEPKLDLPQDLLFEESEAPEILQPTPEISELESAVKFLQESEEQAIDSPLVLSPKVVETTEKSEQPKAGLFVPESDLCEDTENLVAELQDIAPDSIAISEAEIISEAAKLESERQAKMSEKVAIVGEDEISKVAEEPSEVKKSTEGGLLTVAVRESQIVTSAVPAKEPQKSTVKIMPQPPSEGIPKISVLEERLKEPPQIEIPNTSCEIPTTMPRSNLLIPRDAKTGGSQKMLDSPRKDNEPITENVGSPRIILKIAKSAIADCSEPRSPKSPKIRSSTNSPNPEDSPGQKLGKIKLKLSKGGHPSIISNENVEESVSQWHADSSTSSLSPLGVKIKLSKTGDASVVQPEVQEEKSPIGMKIKLSKSGDASVVQPEKHDVHNTDENRRIESPIGMKIKLSKSGDAAIIPQDSKEMPKHRDKRETSQEPPKRTESPIGMKIKLSKSGDASIIQPEDHKEGVKIKERQEEVPKRTESPIGMKIKLSKSGDASIIEESKESGKGKEKAEISEAPKRTESPIGVKIKLSKTGDASIVHPEKQENNELEIKSKERVDLPKRIESPIGMKIKLSKTGDASIISSETSDEQKESICGQKERGESRERRQKSKEPEGPLEMKIKVSKSGHATIVTSETHEESKEITDVKQKEQKEPVLKILKSGNSTILQSNTAEVTIEPIQSSPKKGEKTLQSRKQETSIQIGQKRKEITISAVESKKSKLETKLSQILPEVTIQPVVPKEIKEISGEQKSNVTQQPVTIVNQDISIMHVRSLRDTMPVPSSLLSVEPSMSEKFKNVLNKQPASSPGGSDCEIIEPRPELIIVNENSNSSQDVMIIEEVPAVKPAEAKVPKKRGRPRRNQLQQVAPLVASDPMQVILTKDPLALDEPPPVVEQRENERPRRTCRSQKSYAPPKRGRGRGGGRGKRKIDTVDISSSKRPRIEQNLDDIERNTTALITIDDTPPKKTSEVFKMLGQPGVENKIHVYKPPVEKEMQMDVIEILEANIESKKTTEKSKIKEAVKVTPKAKGSHKEERKTDDIIEIKDGEEKILEAPQNWLTPLSKKAPETSIAISAVQVIDEETRMSAESGSRSQTPARNLAAPVSETIINEESQGSVLSTATTESEKVKVKNRRMEINFDPDEGPFTVDKIAEYEWPLDRKGETFMIQEQISQYLGVKSFKRKYPDLKRRMVDMEERNYLRENGLVSEAMCDMGLTAVCSSEVLDVMCSDFPEQYEEYRKHMREKQVKEHSKKQKELSAAANAERTRIDLAEMAVQSALSWNANLNKSRQDSRKCSLDLQTFTIHVPQKRPLKIDSSRRISHYPVALIPGQYTDFYREYTPAELRYYPLNTVLYGPMRPNERKFDSQSEGSQSDSDSDSSSDDSSSSSSEGTQDTEESQSTMDEVDMEISAHKEDMKNVKCKMCLKNLNKFSKSEVLIQCGTCNGYVHPSCIDLTLDMVPHIQAYSWQCTDCKTCAQCHDPADEDKMLFCDMCDRGYHIYCVGLRRVPQGRWHCQECAVCANCGSKEPAGANADRNSVAQWQHEYKKGDKNIRVYVSTLCVPCSKLWRKGRYCPHCSRCHTAQRLDLETNLVHCSACDKYLHLGCVETKGAQLDRKNYLCDFCSPNRATLPRSLLSKSFKSF